jgi:hypothetical protein
MGGRFNGGRGNGSGRFGNSRGYSGGRGNFQNHSNNENNWMEQPNDRQRGTPQDHYHYNNGPQEAVGMLLAALMDRVLHIKKTISITTKEVGDNEKILKTKQWIWKISLALSTMHTSHLTKTKWKKS